MSEGHNFSACRPRNRRGIPRPITRRDTPPQTTTTVPRTFAAVSTVSGRDESPPSTITTNVAEPTLGDDWVRRTPPAALILPPPPQFADYLPQSYSKIRPDPGVVPFIPPNSVSPCTQTFQVPSPHAPTPVSSPSRSHTVAPATRLFHSHASQASEIIQPSASYAAAVAAPATTRRADTFAPRNSLPGSNADSPHPPRSAIPLLVVECLPNWTGHFRTIAGALGHTPNARPYRKGVMFLPKTEEEYQTVQRCLIEAAAKDSAISWHRHSQDTQTAKVKRRRASIASSQTIVPHTAQREDAVRPLADAAPRDDVPSTIVAPAATDIPDAASPPTGDVITEREALRGRRRRRKRAPRPSRMELPGAVSPQLRQTRAVDRRNTDPDDLPPSPKLLENILRVVVEAVTTGMAGYLHEKDAMPANKEHYPRVQSRVWRTRAGGIPAQIQSPGK